MPDVGLEAWHQVELGWCKFSNRLTIVHVSRKILLVYDDYAEMIRVQSDLMKIGFDVMGIMNEALLPDQLVSFNADLVMTLGTAGKVSAPSVAQKLRENARFNGKVFILLSNSQRLTGEELSRIRMDAVLEFPAPMSKMISVIARLLGLDEKVLLEKLLRLKVESRSPEVSRAALVPVSTAAAQPVRRDRAARLEAAMRSITIDPQQTTFDRKEIKERQENLKKDWDFKRLANLDELKRGFASALFKKSSSKK